MDIHEFENLPASEQEQVFHKSSFKDKAELILHSHDPLALTRSLSQEELYLLTREMDVEERAEVIRFATLPQLFFISDVDCWKKDRLDRKSFLQWIETLLASGDSKLLAWILEMDYETVVAGFYQLIQVMKPDHEWTPDEVLGDTPYFSLDQMYYVFVSEENMETVKRAIEVLFVHHRGRYVALLEGVMGELEDELEEEAYARRESRLAERGFPDFETAQKIYRPITPQEFQDFPLKNKVRLSESRDKEIRIPNYLALCSADKLFLDDVLHSFQEEPAVWDGLQEELAWISNKVIACDGIDFSSEEKVRRGIEKARGFINVGLECLSANHFEKARTILRERWLELIFRWGATQIRLLQEDVRRLIKEQWQGSQVEFLNFLDPPYELIFMGLLRQHPVCYDPQVKGPELLRDFKTASDLLRIRQTVDQTVKIFEGIRRVFPKDLERAKTYGTEKDHPQTLFGFLGTLMAHFVLSGKAVWKPVPLGMASDWMRKGFEKTAQGYTLSARNKKDFSALFESSDPEGTCRPLITLCFERLEDEFSKISHPEKLQPEFIASVCFETQAAKGSVLKPRKKKP